MKRLILLSFLLSCSALWAETATVQIRQASVYTQPSVLSKFLGRLSYGTKVSVLNRKNDWTEITDADGTLKGWTRAQGLTTSNVSLKAGSTTSGVSTTEVSLAGRGFSDPIEKEYRRDNPRLDYAFLDAMESKTSTDAELDAFLSDGGLHPQGARQ